MQIGFIGLGSLGTPIAQNLLEGGNSLCVFNRTASKSAPLEEMGALVCENIAEMAAQCDIIFSIVSDDAALRSICEGEGGLFKNAAAGTIHVSMSTILPQTAADLAALHSARGQHYLAAPVFGRPEAARARKLNFAISGNAEICEKITPLLKDAGGAGVWEFGEDVRAANTVKLCGNFLIASALEAIGESSSLAKKSDIDPKQMWAMFTQTLFNTPLYINYSNIVLQEKFHPAAFTMKLGLKDLKLVLQQAKQVGTTMPLAELLHDHMQQVVNGGQHEIDWSAVSLAATKSERVEL